MATGVCEGERARVQIDAGRNARNARFLRPTDFYTAPKWKSHVESERDEPFFAAM